MNITTQHFDNAGQINNQQPTVKLREQANDILLLSLAFKALTGGVLKETNGIVGPSQVAEVFIINDNSVGRWRVFSVDDIINTLISNMRLIKVQKFSRSQLWEVSYGTQRANAKNNNRYGPAFSRISQLLHMLQAQQIKLSINRAALFSKNNGVWL